MTLLLQLAREPWAQALGWALLHFLWQGAILGGLAWGLLALLRGGHARTRYAVACAFLLAMVAAPVLTFLHLRVGSPVAGQGPVQVVLEGGGPIPVPLTVQARLLLTPLLPWLLGTWALGVAILSLRFAGGWLWLQRLRHRGAAPVPAEWHLVLSRLCRELKLSRTVRLLQSASVEVPTVLGWLWPVILLPACALTGLAPDQLEAVLAHELAHIRRADYAVNLLQTFVEVLLFYHPAMWWLSGRIRAERELCCDDVAAAISGDPLILARALTVLEGLRDARPTPSTLALAANGGSLMHRIRHLLHPTLPLSPRARAGALALLAVSLLGAAGAALQEPAAKPARARPAEGGKNAVQLKVLDGDRRLVVHLEGEVNVDPAAADPVTVGKDGSLRIEERRGARTRTYSATPTQRTYAVDGKARPLDPEADAWLRSALKDVQKAQAGREKARAAKEKVRWVRVQAQAEQDRQAAQAEELKAQAKMLEAQVAKEQSPEAQAHLKAELERSKAEMEKAKAEIERSKADLDQARNLRLEVIQEDVKGPQGASDKDGKRRDVVVRKFVWKDKDGKPREAPLPPGEDIVVEAPEVHVRVPRPPRIRVKVMPPVGEADDPQAEMVALQAEMAALKARMAELKDRMKQMPKARKPGMPPPPPAPPVPPAPPKDLPAPPPPPPPPPPPAPEK